MYNRNLFQSTLHKPFCVIYYCLKASDAYPINLDWMFWFWKIHFWDPSRFSDELYFNRLWQQQIIFNWDSFWDVQDGTEYLADWFEISVMFCWRSERCDQKQNLRFIQTFAQSAWWEFKIGCSNVWTWMINTIISSKLPKTIQPKTGLFQIGVTQIKINFHLYSFRSWNDHSFFKNALTWVFTVIPHCVDSLRYGGCCFSKQYSWDEISTIALSWIDITSMEKSKKPPQLLLL